jgi:hypothetical protein
MTLKPQAKAAAEGEHCRPQNLPGELGESGFQVFEGVEGRRTGSLSAVRDLASHDRGFHFHIANSFRFDVKDVVTQDDHVREFAGRNGAFLVFLTFGECRAHGIGFDRLR